MQHFPLKSLPLPPHLGCCPPPYPYNNNPIPPLYPSATSPHRNVFVVKIIIIIIFSIRKGA